MPNESWHAEAVVEVCFLPRKKAAEYVQTKYGFPCSPRWLAKLAVVGGGPRFLKSGRNPVYAPAWLDTWALGRLGLPADGLDDAAYDGGHV